MGLALLSLALTLSLAVTFRLSRHLDRLEANREANRAVESILESVRARDILGAPGYRKWEQPLGTGEGAADKLQAWVEVAPTAVDDLFLVSVLVRYKVLDQPHKIEVQTQVWWP